MMLKRILYIITAAVLLLSLAACGDTDATQPTEAEPPTMAPTEAPATYDEPSEGFKLTRFIKEFSHDATIEEQVLYDDGSVTLTAKGIRYDAIAGAVLQLQCTNNSEEVVMIQADNAAVNGYMMPVELSLKTAAGKSADGELTVSYKALALAGLDRVATVEFSPVMIDPVSYEVLSTCDPVTVATTAAEGYDPPVPEDGQTVYDKGGVKIVLMGLDDSLQFADANLIKVYMKNDSDKDVSIQTDAVKVNGYDLTSAMTTTVRSGRQAMDIVTFFEQDMEEYDIQEIDSVELSFKIVDEKTWKVIDRTNPVLAEL